MYMLLYNAIDFINLLSLLLLLLLPLLLPIFFFVFLFFFFLPLFTFSQLPLLYYFIYSLFFFSFLLNSLSLYVSRISYFTTLFSPAIIPFKFRPTLLCYSVREPIHIQAMLFILIGSPHVSFLFNFFYPACLIYIFRTFALISRTLYSI